MTSIYKKSQVCSFNNLYAICINETKIENSSLKKNQSNFKMNLKVKTRSTKK